MEIDRSFSAFMNYGLTCSLIEHNLEAEVAFENALQIEPDCADAHYRLAITIPSLSSFHDSVRMRKVVTHLRESLRLRPDHELSAEFLGTTLVLHLHAFDEARAFAHEIEERFPDLARHIRFIIQLNEPLYTQRRGSYLPH